MMSNFTILFKTPLIFPIPWAPAPFPKRGVRALLLCDFSICHISVYSGTSGSLNFEYENVLFDGEQEKEFIFIHVCVRMG